MSKNKISKNNSIQVTVPSSSTRLQNAIKHAESSSNSSSDDEIFQTRFSQSRATLNKQNESNIDDIYMIEPDVEMIPPEGNDLKKDNQKRKSPIIIQAKAHKEENKDMIESRREVKELKTSNKGAGYTDSQQIDFLSELSKKLDSVSADSLSVEVNTPNTDIGSSSIEPVNQNSELLNGNNLNNPLYKTSEEMSDQILLTNINNSVNQNVENLDANSCDVIQNFLNGSLNVNEYKNEEILENKNYFMKALQSVDACSKTSKAIVETPHVDLTDISGKNIFTKRYAHQPQKGQKRQKSDRKNSNKTEDFTEISSQNQKMNSKIVKKPQIKRKRSTIVRKRDESVDSSNSEVDEICHKNANATQELNLLNNLPCYKDDTVINSIHSFDSYDEIETATNNSMKINNVRNNKNKSNTYKTNKTLMPRRHTRNSSLIASKKIKEIERLENLFDGDEIYVDSASEKDYMVVSENTMQNKEKNILEDSFKNGKENSKKHFIKGLTSYVKHNDKNFAENEFCFQMNNKTGPIKSKRSNKKSKILIHNKLETFNAITDKCNIKNKSIYTDLMKNLNGSDEHISENDLQENVEVSSELHSDRRKNQIKECVNKENKVLNHYNDVFNKDLTLKYDPFKPQKNIPQCRYKTWDDLENELLGGFNNKFNNEGNISKTVTIKKKQLFQKEMTKEENLLTVSNTSMTQMISKSRDGNYNMRYEIQNIKSKYMESVPSIYKFQSTNSFVKRDASKSTSKCILEKTLAAMEKCTANFIKPQKIPGSGLLCDLFDE